MKLSLLDHEFLVKYYLLAPAIFVLPVVYYGSSTFRKSKIREDWEKYYEDVKVLAPYLKPKDKADTRTLVGLLVAVFLCVGIGRGINVVSPLMLRNILDQLSTTTGREGPFPWKQIAGYVLFRYSFRDTIGFVEWAVTRRLENQVLDRITIAVYDKMMSLSADYHDNKNSGTVWLTVHNSGKTVSRIASMICFDIVPTILDLAFAVVAFGSVCGAHLAWIFIVVMGVYLVVSAKSSEMESGNAEEWTAAMDKRDSLASDTIPNWWTVDLFGRLDYEKERHAQAVHHMRTVDTKWCDGQWLSYNAKHLVMSTGLLILTLLVSKDIWYDSERSAGDLVMFLHLWAGITRPIQSVLDWGDRVKECSTDAKRLLEILRQEATIKDVEDAPDFKFKTGTIFIKDVSFSYPENHEPVIDNISLEIPEGKIVAIVGASGGGKSTLLKLLMRSYDIASGTITIDGQDIRSVRKASLLQHMSIVPQSVGVFNTSILSNLRYANPTATLAQCEEACQAVGLHAKITTAFPSGYDEIIGEKGGKLSGGELQRLAIARVLLRADAGILLLDEAMSSLDSETEGRILEYLKKWWRGKTVIIVAHRLASVVGADEVVAVKEGRIVERGEREELLERKGYFWSLWKGQRLE